MTREYKPSNFEDMARAAKAAADAARAAGADEATVKRSAFAAAEALAVHESDPRPEQWPSEHLPDEPRPPRDEPVWAPPSHLPVVEDPAKERMGL